MLARSALSRVLPQCAPHTTRRGMAAAANPFHYSVADASGIKVVSRDDEGPTTALAVVVRGGSRYQTAPGVAHALAKFAFKNTTKRSALRLTREIELLGGKWSSEVTRENIILRAKFLREDLPYFVEAMGDVLSKTKYLSHQFSEEVATNIQFESRDLQSDPAAFALETAHNVAFHTGLGAPRLAMTDRYLSHSATVEYAHEVYKKGNLAVVASGASQSALEKWTRELMGDVNAGTAIQGAPSKYYGGENRVFTPIGDALAIAFSGSQGAPSFKPEYAVLAYILGGQSSIKWNAGSSALAKAVGDSGVSAVAKNATYTDAGLLYVTITGPAKALAQAGQAVVKAINGLTSASDEEVKRAIAQAKFDVLANAEDRNLGLEYVGESVIASGKAPQTEERVKALEGVTVDAVKKAAQAMLKEKASFAAVGNTDFLPFAVDLGLNV